MTDSSCRRASEHLSLLLDGRLPPPEAGEVREHLAECSPCRAEWEALRELSDSLAALPRPEPRPDALQRLHAALQGPPSRLPLRVLGYAAVVVVAVAACCLAVFLWFGSAPGSALVAQALAGSPGPVTVRPLDHTQLSPAPARVQSAPVRSGTVAHARRPLRTTGPKRHRARPLIPTPGPAAQEPGSSAVVVVTSPGPVPALSVWAPEPGRATWIGSMGGADGEPVSQVFVTRTVGADRTIEHVSIACHPMGGVPASVETPAPSANEEENPDEPNDNSEHSGTPSGGGGCAHADLPAGSPV